MSVQAAAKAAKRAGIVAEIRATFQRNRDAMVAVLDESDASFVLRWPGGVCVKVADNGKPAAAQVHNATRYWLSREGVVHAPRVLNGHHKAAVLVSRYTALSEAIAELDRMLAMPELQLDGER